MSFEAVKVRPVMRDGAAPNVCLSLCLYNEAYSIAIHIGPQVLERTGWTTGTRLQLLEGKDSDAGLFKLNESESGLKLSPPTLRGVSTIRFAANKFHYHTFDKEVLRQIPTPVLAQVFASEVTAYFPDWIIKF